MSGINCGTYPLASSADAQTVLDEQQAEYTELTDTYNDLDALYDTAYATYGNTLDDYNTLAGEFDDAYSTKAVARASYNTNSVAVNIQPVETNYVINPFGTVTKPTSVFQNTRVNWFDVESTRCQGVFWRTYSNGVLVGVTIQDMGDFAVKETDQNDFFNLCSFLQLQVGATGGSSFITSQTISDDADNISTQYRTRFSVLTSYP